MYKSFKAASQAGLEQFGGSFKIVRVQGGFDLELYGQASVQTSSTEVELAQARDEIKVLNKSLDLYRSERIKLHGLVANARNSKLKSQIIEQIIDLPF